MSPSTPSSKPTIPFQPNPFTNLAVGSPWTDSPADVARINREAFELLQRSVRQTRLGNDPISVVVTGEPGSGKTHLLSRLKKYLEVEIDGEKPWYVYVRCHASANTLWRHLLRCLATDLLQTGRDGRHRLEELLRGDTQRLRQLGHLGLHRALESLASGRHTLAATAWLRGETLSDADLAALGIGIEKEDEDRSRETEAKNVVEALLRFLSPTPLVICFDQVEALETYRGEQAGYHALGQMVSTLVNGEHRRLLLISCVVAAFEDNLDKLPNGADRDRWLQEKATLAPIEWEPAVELVSARLDSAPALRQLRERHAGNPVWPLDEGPLRALFAKTGRCLPRDLIKVCKIEFNRQMGDVEPRPKISREAFLQQEYTRLLAEARAESRKLGGETVLENSLPWLLQNSGMRVLGKSTTPGYANVVCQNNAGEVALMFCYRPGTAFTNRLKKADKSWRGQPELRILSEPAIQPKRGSKGAQILDQLRRHGAQQIHPLPEALAALQAIRNLTATARAGELTLDGDPVSEDAASQWALSNLPPQLEALRDALSVKAENGPNADLLALVHRHKVVEAEVAARELSISAEEVAYCARRYPMHFGLLEGPPLVLFEAVEGFEAEAAHA